MSDGQFQTWWQVVRADVPLGRDVGPRCLALRFDGRDTRGTTESDAESARLCKCRIVSRRKDLTRR